MKDVKWSSFFGSVVMQLLKPLESLESRLVLEIPARSRWRDHLRDVSSESIASSGWCQIFDPKCEISLLESYFLANICIQCFVNVIDTIICILFIWHNEHTESETHTNKKYILKHTHTHKLTFIHTYHVLKHTIIFTFCVSFSLFHIYKIANKTGWLNFIALRVSTWKSISPAMTAKSSDTRFGLLVLILRASSKSARAPSLDSKLLGDFY